jgi:putative ABC transport system substrate-binding protein
MLRGGDLPIEQSAKFGLLIAQGPRRQQVVEGTDLDDLFWRTALFVDSGPQGRRPTFGSSSPRKFESVINVRTARALRLTIPQSILLRPDAVTE